VRDFTDTVVEKAIGGARHRELKAGQVMIKIVYDSSSI